MLGNLCIPSKLAVPTTKLISQQLAGEIAALCASLWVDVWVQQYSHTRTLMASIPSRILTPCGMGLLWEVAKSRCGQHAPQKRLKHLSKLTLNPSCGCQHTVAHLSVLFGHRSTWLRHRAKELFSSETGQEDQTSMARTLRPYPSLPCHMKRRKVNTAIPLGQKTVQRMPRFGMKDFAQGVDDLTMRWYEYLEGQGDLSLG